MSAVRRAQRVGMALGATLAIIAAIGELLVDLRSRLLGFLFLSAEILGRTFLVMAGIAPSKGEDEVKIVLAGLTVLVVLLFAWPRRKLHQSGSK